MSAVPGWLALVRRAQPRLWVAAVLLYGVGDTATTAIGLSDSTAREAGPVVLVAVEAAGIAGLFAAKIGFIGLAFAVWYVVRTPGRAAIPLALAVAGGLVTAWNALVLLA